MGKLFGFLINIDCIYVLQVDHLKPIKLANIDSLHPITDIALPVIVFFVTGNKLYINFWQKKKNQYYIIIQFPKNIHLTCWYMLLLILLFFVPKCLRYLILNLRTTIFIIIFSLHITWDPTFKNMFCTMCILIFKNERDQKRYIICTR